MNRANVSWNLQNQLADSDGIKAGTLLEKEVEITSAEIKALVASAKELVPAPGAGKVLEFCGAIIKHIAGTAYAEPTAPDDLVIQYSGGQDVTAELDVTGFIDQTDDEIRQMPPSVAAMATTVDMYALSNTSLVLFNTGGEYTTGTGKLNVRIMYRIHDFN